MLREIAPGHELHGRNMRVIARAISNDDVIVVADDQVAIVHLTWTSRKADLPPFPRTRFVDSVEAFAMYGEAEFGDWEA